MGNVTPIKRKGDGEPPCAGAYIDSASYVLLVEALIGLLELCVKEGDQCLHGIALLSLARQLEQLAERFTPPKGAA